MTIPDFQSLMLPFLTEIGDGQEYSIRELINSLASRFGLSDDERKELLSSGRQPRFDNRVHWTRIHLKAAGLLLSPKRGIIKITERGKNILKSSVGKIDIKFLSQYPEYVEFRKSTKSNDNQHNEEIKTEIPQTPEELLESCYQDIRKNLAQELLNYVNHCSPAFFEKLVVDLLVSMGYGGSRKDAGQAIGKSGDGGIDGIIKEDRLGLDVVYIQAKRWDGTVGRPVVQAFAGSLEGYRANKGVMITSSSFTNEAIDYVSKIGKKIVLINGDDLAKYMIDYSIGVTQVASYTINKVDTDYFDED